MPACLRALRYLGGAVTVSFEQVHRGSSRATRAPTWARVTRFHHPRGARAARCPLAPWWPTSIVSRLREFQGCALKAAREAWCERGRARRGRAGREKPKRPGNGHQRRSLTAIHTVVTRGRFRKMQTEVVSGVQVAPTYTSISNRRSRRRTVRGTSKCSRSTPSSHHRPRIPHP